MAHEEALKGCSVSCALVCVSRGIVIPKVELIVRSVKRNETKIILIIIKMTTKLTTLQICLKLQRKNFSIDG